MSEKPYCPCCQRDVQEFGRLCADCDRFFDHLEAKLAKAKAVLREVEWSGDRPDRVPYCPVCRGRPTQAGHAPDCRLKKAIEG